MRRPHMFVRAGTLAGVSRGIAVPRPVVEQPRGAGINRRGKLVAVAVIGLVLLTALAWVAFGAQGLGDWLATGRLPGTGLAAIGAAPVQPGAGQEGAQGIDIAGWMPVWILVELGVFVWLGMFLRADQGNKP